jgi:cell division protease FtsH
MLSLFFSEYGKSGDEISVSQASIMIQNGEVEKLHTQGGVGKIKLLNDSDVGQDSFPTKADYYFEYTNVSLTMISNAVNKFNEANPDAEINWTDLLVEASFLDQIYPYLFIGMFILGIVFLYRMLASSNKGAMSFGKSKAKSMSNIKVRFSDVAGADEEKEELQEIVEFLKNPQKFISLGARIPKGILLVGNPGTGKTLLARAVAGESNVPFLSISGSDFVEMFVGVGASRVRDMFEEAKKNAPCIVFIDEIDAVGRQRGAGLGGGNDEREQTLNQLLVEMDGFEANEGIIILAATNRSDVLDPALLRPGRFDRQIYVHVPDVKGREGILKIHARNKPIDEDVSFETLARITSGFTGADIENMLNEAAILAARQNRAKILMEDLTEGINKVIMGPQKKSRVVTERDKNITAYHEAGHAILGKVLPHCEPIQEVSIIPRGAAAGYTMSRPENDDNHLTQNKLNDDIAMTMGGRIAEEIIFKDITTGASSDIQKATQIARKMVTEWGMSDIGFMAFEGEDRLFIGRDYQTKNNYSEKMAAEVDGEIHKIINNNYTRAKKVLLENIGILHNMSKLLLAKNTIYHEEVEWLFEGKSVEEIVATMDEREKTKNSKAENDKVIMKEIQTLKAIEKKIETGKVFLKNGIITQADLDLLHKKKEKQEKVILKLQKEMIKVTPDLEMKEDKNLSESKSETDKKSKKPAEAKKVKIVELENNVGETKNSEEKKQTKTKKDKKEI